MPKNQTQHSPKKYKYEILLKVIKESDTKWGIKYTNDKIKFSARQNCSLFIDIQ